MTMTREIRYDDNAAAYYVAKTLNVALDLDWHNAIGVYIDGMLAGGVLYTDFNRHSICAHIAAKNPRWLSKDVLWAIHYWPFTVLGCKVIFGYVHEKNEHALKLDLKLGFKIHARVPDVFADGDLLVLSMYKQDCRHLDIPYRGHAYGKQSA